MSQYTRTSEIDPALTVAFGWDRQMSTFFAWAGPNGGDCDPDELVFNVGDLPGDVPNAHTLAVHLNNSGHLHLSPEDIGRLVADQRETPSPVRAPNLQKLMDSMLEGLQ